MIKRILKFLNWTPFGIITVPYCIMHTEDGRYVFHDSLIINEILLAVNAYTITIEWVLMIVLLII
jgi:hypothetical protein